MTASTYRTADGVAVPAVTAAQMREVDRVAVEETGPNLFQMMENAGRSLAETAIDLLGPEWRDRSIVVLAGTGGNGGGGICAARHLANRGVEVIVVVTDLSRLGDVPARQLEVFSSTPGRVAERAVPESASADLVVDALVGYSLTGPPRGVVGDLIEWADSTGVPCLSLDVPSGVDASTGDIPGWYVSATRTLTLALPKTGLDVTAVGDLWLGDIGIPAETYRRAGLVVPSEVFGERFIGRIEPETTGPNATER